MAYHTSFQFEHILKSISCAQHVRLSEYQQCMTSADLPSMRAAFWIKCCDYLQLQTETGERAYDVIERCNAIRTCLEMKLYLVQVSNDPNCIKSIYIVLYIRVYKMYTMNIKKDWLYIYPDIDSKFRANYSLDLINKIEALIHFSIYDVQNILIRIKMHAHVM